jgi:hypothetical protein
MNQYDFSPLRQIGEFRVLVLAPCQDSESGQVICSLRHVQRAAHPDYDALSYCWGGELKPKHVICDGKTLNVTESLYSALRHLSYTDRERHIWADAICIDQSNGNEKNIQVAMMRDIYSMATRTVVWLADDERGEAAINMVEKFHSSGKLDISCLEASRVLKSLTDYPWHRRLWVIQEVALAKQVVVAVRRSTVSLEPLLQLIQMIPDREWYEGGMNIGTVVNLININSVRTKYRESRLGHPLQIIDLLHVLPGFDTTNKKDTIYALLGLTGPDTFPINYHPTYSLEEMFKDFAKWALYEFPSLALLSYTRGLGEGCKCQIPSWAPCHDMPGVSMSLLGVSHFNVWGREDKSNSTTGNAVVQFDGDGNLCLKGMLIDTVKDVLEHHLNLVFPEQQQTAIREAMKLAGCLESAANLDNPAYKRFCTALVLGLEHTHQRAGSDYVRCVDEYIRRENESSEDFKKVERAMSYWPYYRHFATTTGGRFAWVPWRIWGTVSGDRICMFRGGRIPYVIRPRDDGTDIYTLVGECWVEDLMEGEALSLATREEIIRIS